MDEGLETINTYYNNGIRGSKKQMQSLANKERLFSKPIPTPVKKMNSEKVKAELSQQYPGKDIFMNKNELGEVTEILCEIEPTTHHPEYSVAIAVIDTSLLHYHSITTETYKIIKGPLDLYVDDKIIKLNTGDEFTIRPGQKHRAVGNETWIECTSKPGWTFKDHLIVI